MKRIQRRIYCPVLCIGLALCIGLSVGSCGTANDQEAASGSRVGDDTRYEIVIVDSIGHQVEEDEEPISSSTTRMPPQEEASSTPLITTPPPPPGVDDEAGGDGLLSFDPDGQYVVQVGVLKDLGKARKRVRELVELGYPAFLAPRPSAGQTRIRIGYFSSHEDAKLFGQRFVRDHGGEFWVDRRAQRGDG